MSKYFSLSDILPIILTVFLLISSCIGFNYALASGCNRQGLIMGRSVQYTFLTGCLIKDHTDSWLPIENYLSVRLQ